MDKHNDKNENQMQFKGPAADFFKQNPDFLASIQNRITQRGGQLKALKERTAFLNDQMKLLKGQAELYTSTGQEIPQDLKTQVGKLHQQISRVGSEYERANSNVNPVQLPDPGDISVDLDGEEVFINPKLLDLALQGNPKAMQQLQGMQDSGNAEDSKEARATIKALSERFVENEQEQLRYKDNGELELTRSGDPAVIAPVTTAAPKEDLANKNSNIIQSLKDAMSRGEKDAAGVVGAAASMINKNIKTKGTV